MHTYTFDVECLVDLGRLLVDNRLDIRSFAVTVNSFALTTYSMVVLQCGDSLPTVRAAMERVVDGHVMLRTLKEIF